MEDKLMPATVKLAAGATSSEKHLLTRDSLNTRKDDILHVHRTGEMVRVKVVTKAGILVQRAYRSRPAQALMAGDELIIVGTAVTSLVTPTVRRSTSRGSRSRRKGT